MYGEICICICYSINLYLQHGQNHRDSINPTPAEINGEWKEVLKYEPGGFFGERALLRPDG
jgi:hypothetical protein